MRPVRKVYYSLFYLTLISYVLVGRRTTHNPFNDKDKAWDPYGVAKLDLSELLLGQRYLYMSIPVHNCPSPDPTVGHERLGGSIVGHAGSVDGPGRPKYVGFMIS